MTGRTRFTTMLAIAMMLAIYAVGATSPGKKLLDDMQFSEYPNSNFISETNIVEGKQLGEMEKQFGALFGMAKMKEINQLVYGIDADAEAQKIYAFFQPSIEKQEWQTLVSSFGKNKSTAIFYKEKQGIFILTVGPQGDKERKLTLIRIYGEVDASKIGLKSVSGEIVEAISVDTGKPDRIPIGQTISVPPSEKLYIISTGTNIKAQLAEGNTVEVDLEPRGRDAGKLIRTGEVLTLELEPKIDVDSTIPTAVPVILKLTDGSLMLKGGAELQGKASRLTVDSTSAPVTIESLPLVAGEHSIKAVGDKLKVDVQLSKVEGGSLSIEVTGADVTVVVPKKASAKIEVSATSGKIENLTDVQPTELSDDNIKLQLGDGKASILVKAVKSTVSIKSAN